MQAVVVSLGKEEFNVGFMQNAIVSSVTIEFKSKV